MICCSLKLNVLSVFLVYFLCDKDVNGSFKEFVGNLFNVQLLPVSLHFLRSVASQLC